MPTKSYTLADGSTATVTATENGVPFNEGMQALTKAIKAKIANSTKPTPNLSLGGWSIADTVYTAPITYDGDGELSVNVGSISNGSLIVNDADGIFNGVLTASAGESYASAAFGFSYDTDYVTIQGGGTASDNKLERFLNSRPDYLVAYDDEGSYIRVFPQEKSEQTFLWGQVTVSTGINDASQQYIISSATNNSIYFGADNNTLAFECYLHKVSETAGFVYRICQKITKDGYGYRAETYLFPFEVKSNGSIGGGQSGTAIGAKCNRISPACSSVESAQHTRKLVMAQSCMSPHHYTALNFNRSGTATAGSGIFSCCLDAKSANWQTITASAAIGTIKPNPNGNDNLDDAFLAPQYPAIVQFAGQDVTISKGTDSTSSPFFYYQRRTRNSSGFITAGADYVAVNSGFPAANFNTAKITTIVSGVESTVNPWVEDDGYFIHGTYPNKERTDCYVVTYKPGTYSKDTYLQDAFKIWNVDFNAPRFVQSSKTLPQVLDDLVI